MRILVVEDEPRLLHNMAKALREECGLALGLGGGWLLVTSAIRPVRDIGEAATRISAGNLSERINVSETDSELGRLAGVLNSTFARLEAAFSPQRQFTADASHELRTPLSVIISEAQRVSTRLEGELALLEVVDTGQGISPEDLPHIFERFYRGDKSRASGQSRNGLGLAICKSIVDAHGGSIEATSQRGIGTTFTVKLPAATPADESAGLVV